jgi:hypothetical protein
MKIPSSKRRTAALTLTEVLVVIVVAAILFGVMLPWLAHRYPGRPHRLNCTRNLKEVGLAFQVWALDHGDKFPMAVSTHRGGSLEFVPAGETFRHLVALSNELSSPKVLVCPADLMRRPAARLGKVRSHNLSYFVGLDADQASPQMILAGDRNVTGGTTTTEVITYFRTNSLAGWTSGLHSNCGNIGLADGSVQTVNGASLRQQLHQQGKEFIRLAIP